MKHEGKIQPKREFILIPKAKQKKKKEEAQDSIQRGCIVCKETKLKSSNSYTVNMVGFRVQINYCIVVVGLLICSPKDLPRSTWATLVLIRSF